MEKINFKKEKLLLVSIGLVYIYFGVLKFFPTLSPAEAICGKTICALTFDLFSTKTSMILCGAFEVGIGAIIILGKYRKLAISLALFHMIMTLSPLILFPEDTFNGAAFIPTLLGQYIMKNVIIICALIVVYPKNNVVLKKAVI